MFLCRAVEIWNKNDADLSELILMYRYGKNS